MFNILMFDIEVSDFPVPLWLKLMFGPGILWFLFSAFLGSWICWRFIFGNSSDNVLKADKRSSIIRTGWTLFLCNLLSCVLLLVVEFIMRTSEDIYISLSSLKIWDSPLTVVVYMIPVVISFFIIKKQVKSRGYYMVSDRTPVKIASWFMAILYTPWYIIVPMSLIIDLSQFIEGGGGVIIE